jgi:hypothetical protein
VWPHHGETVGAGCLENRGEHGRPRAVGIGLDDGDQFDGAERALEYARVGPGRIEVDLDPAMQIAGGVAQRALCALRLYQLTDPFPPADGPFDQPARANLASDW